MTLSKHVKYSKIKPYKYKNEELFEIQLDIASNNNMSHNIDDMVMLSGSGLLTISVGYAWDGPSGPTIDTPSFMRGSLVHDALYQLMSVGFLNHAHRQYADRLLQKMCMEDGMWRFRAWYVYHAVRAFGEKYAKYEGHRNIKYYLAP